MPETERTKPCHQQVKVFATVPDIQSYIERFAVKVVAIEYVAYRGIIVVLEDDD